MSDNHYSSDPPMALALPTAYTLLRASDPLMVSSPLMTPDLSIASAPLFALLTELTLLDGISTLDVAQKVSRDLMHEFLRPIFACGLFKGLFRLQRPEFSTASTLRDSEKGGSRLLSLNSSLTIYT